MKRGYFFSLDAVIAILILAGGLVFLFTQLGGVPDIETPKHLSTDLMSLLFDVKIKDICSGPMVSIPECQCVYLTIQDEFYCRGKVIDTELTLLEFFGLLYDESPSNVVYINQMINETISESRLVPPNYEFTFLLRDHAIPGTDPITIYPAP